MNNEIANPLIIKSNQLSNSFYDRIGECDLTYREMLSAAFEFKSDVLNDRVACLIISVPKTKWQSEKHRMNMFEANDVLGYHHSRNTRRFYAAMYLLTVNQEIIDRSWGCFRHDGIDFKKLKLEDITPIKYAILMFAKQIYTGQEYLTEEDFADSEIIDDETFKLIINAMLIVKYGLCVLKK